MIKGQVERFDLLQTVHENVCTTVFCYVEFVTQCV